MLLVSSRQVRNRTACLRNGLRLMSVKVDAPSRATDETSTRGRETNHRDVTQRKREIRCDVIHSSFKPQ